MKLILARMVPEFTRLHEELESAKVNLWFARSRCIDVPAVRYQSEGIFDLLGTIRGSGKYASKAGNGPYDEVTNEMEHSLRARKQENLGCLDRLQSIALVPFLSHKPAEIDSKKDNFRTFRYLPLRVDQKKRISRHKLDSGPNGTWESTGEYQYYYWPYDELTIRTHANPLKSIWHAGKELAKLHGEELVALVNDLEDVGSDLSTAIRYITTLYRRWNPDLNKKDPSTKEQKDPVTEAAPDSIPAQPSPAPPVEQSGPDASADDKVPLLAHQSLAGW
ncbi:hypothetical protein C8J56DRAFT_881037 [Mycena floridula]|nr:hypothetical protein C8J56DRAFT_881037 [Mycena floridula]